MSIIGGTSDNVIVRPHVWNTSTLAYEAMNQVVTTINTMTVSGTTALTKIGGTA